MITMSNEMILFSILWIALMMIYFLGDVIRIFAGDFIQGEMDGQKMSQNMWFMAAVIMLVPIIMVILNITISFEYMKWPNIVVSILFLLFNLSGIKGYKFYDQFLLVVSFLLNILIVYLASNL